MILWSVKAIVSGFLFFCTVLGNENHNNDTIQEVINKLYNISANSLNKSEPNQRIQILNRIENKLRSSTMGFGEKADKYVQIVMHGVRALMNNNTINKNKRKHGKYLSSDKVGKDFNKRDSRKANKEIIDGIANKMLEIARKYLKDAKSPEEKKSVMERIQSKVVDVALKNNGLDKSGSKAYANVINRGLKQMMKKLASQNQNERRTDLENENKNKYNGINHSNVNFVVQKNKDLKVDTTTPYNTALASTPFQSCDVTVSETCEDIRLLQIYKCSNASNVLPLNKLCDGIKDCPDKSDEENCIDQAMMRMRGITRIMSHLETYILEKCFLSSDNTILIKQKEMLQDVLYSQRTFLQRFSGINSVDKLKEKNKIKATSHEVASVLQTIAIALDGSLCLNEIPDRNKMNARKALKVFDDDDVVIQGKAPIEECKCNNSFCVDLSCPESCKLICWYKHSLTRWSCHAIDETTSIPINEICDGKLDCYDESDETGCNTGSQINKFEANEVYDKILNIVEIKSKSNEYAKVYNKLMLLYNSVKLLQKMTLAHQLDMSGIQKVRDQCFQSLLSIYEDIVTISKSVADLDDVQMFLQSLNEKLVSALKRSAVGNEKVVRRDGCLCRKNKCILQNCPNICQRACHARPYFTKYWCKGSKSNISVPLEWICNNRQDCPFEDDEGHCVVDNCKKFHLRAVQENLRYVGDDKKGTSLGETLKEWREKAISTLKAAEDNYRPTPTTYRDIILDVLNNLAMKYAAMEEISSRRNRNETHFKYFFDTSQKVIENLKLCTK